MSYYPIIESIGKTVCVKRGDELVKLSVGDSWGGLTLMATLFLPECGQTAVFEDFSNEGVIAFVNEQGLVLELKKNLEQTRIDESECYLGYSKEEVFAASEDILAKKILEKDGDPDFDTVKNCIPPIRRMKYYEFGDEAPHTYIGSLGNADVIPLFYDANCGSTRVNPFFVTRDIEKAVESQTLWEGLIGGWLPVVRIVYPVDGETSWDSTMFAKTRTENPLIQTAWYRFMKIRAGKVIETHYYDSYLPYPLYDEPSPEGFYRDLFFLHNDWHRDMPAGMELDLPDKWIDDFCKHSFVLERITRFGAHPRYGLINKNYGSQEHDGFMDTLTASVETYLEWGMTGLAKEYLEYYFTYFVREDGSVLYRGPSIGRYAKMLADIAQYYNYTKDAEFIFRFEHKIWAIVELLMKRRDEAKRLSKDSPRYGMLVGRNEADMSFLFNDTLLYDSEHPYFSINATAWRGFRDLGRALSLIGREHGLKNYADLGVRLVSEARELDEDIRLAMKRSLLNERGAPFLPTIAGSDKYYYDYPYRSCPDSFDDNREWCEIMHAGNIPKEIIDIILKDAREHQWMKLGIFSNRKLVVAFICYGEAYGLIQHDMIKEFLLFYYTHILHLNTRGTWSGFECVDLDRERAESCSYCTPAQMTVPIVTKWMLVFEDPLEDVLWLAKATPERWLEDGEKIEVKRAPTKWGSVDYSIVSGIDKGAVKVSVLLPESFSGKALLRLRMPKGKAINKVCLDGLEWTDFCVSSSTITVPNRAGRIEIDVSVV